MTTRRKKPRLFSFSREVEIANFEEVVTDPHERRVLEGMVDGFLEICRTQAVSAETLGAVACAARHPSPYVRGVGITRLTVLADFIFTTPAVLIQLLSGFALLHMLSLPWTTPWVLVALGLYALTGACWLPVVFIQMRLARMAAAAQTSGQPLPIEFARQMRIWFVLGWPAFLAVLAIFWLMVRKAVSW